MGNRGSETQLRSQEADHRSLSFIPDLELDMDATALAEAWGLRGAPHLSTQAPPALAQTPVLHLLLLAQLSYRGRGTEELLGPRICPS